MPLPLLFQAAKAKRLDPLALAITEYEVATAAFLMRAALGFLEPTTTPAA